MNIKEINEIQDSGLKVIRMKYWNLRHKAFLDEHRVSDQELEKVWSKLDEAEEKEVAAYFKEQGKQGLN